MSRKKVLIVSYTFPPNPGIGGRRWAKFAKYLNRSDVDVRVLTFQNNLGSNSNQSAWDKDILEYKDKIDRVVANKPYYLQYKSPDTLLGKIRYKISLAIKRTQWKANYYDEAISMKDQFMTLIDAYYKQGYTNLIITCAPFLLSYFGALFKEKNPGINLILDFRDPWTTNQMGYQYRFLPSDRLKKEKAIEEFSINKANVVYAVNQSMVNYFNSLLTSTNIATKVKRLNNGYDKEDFNKGDNAAKITNAGEKLHFVFAGAIYEELEYVLFPFIHAINQLGSIAGIEERVAFSFYGNVAGKYAEVFKPNKILSIHKQVALEEIHRIIDNASSCMLFLTKDLKDSFSTKFYEYILHKKLILVFSEKGETGNFVEENSIGIHISPDEMYDKIEKIIFTRELISYNQEFDSTKFDINELTKEIYTDLI